MGTARLAGGLLLAALVMVVAPASAQDLDERHFEIKIISRGLNRPPIDLARIHADKLLALVKEGMSEAQLREHVFPDGVDAAVTLDVLLAHGFVEKRPSGRLVPTVAVMTLEAVSAHMPVDASIIDETVTAVRAYAPKAFDALASLDGFSHLRRDQYDLFLLSNGLLDNFQIANVEAQVIAAERPQRAGGRYYLSVQEKAPGTAKEAFAIYGNHTGTYGAYILGVYGNQRSERTDFHRMREALFLGDTAPGSSALHARRGDLVDALAKLWQSEEIPKAYRRVLEQLGFVSVSGALSIPVLTRKNYGEFSRIVAEFTPTLIRILRRHLPRLQQRYANSSFAQDIPFEEYFIWWYHLYYSAVTDALLAAGIVHVPAQGVATYLMIPDPNGTSGR